MSQGFYLGIKCGAREIKKRFNPTEHQLETFQKFIESKHKGMLLYHKLGSGKTCTSIMIADYMLENKIIERVFVLTPGSLRQTWITEYCRLCGKSSESLRDNYFFITYNYSVGSLIKNVNFENSLVIIDEVHNIINGAKNMSETYTSIYNVLLGSNCRILALSGTPIYNYFYEFALLGNLLKPGHFPEIRNFQRNAIDKDKYTELFYEDDSKVVLPRDIAAFEDSVEGIISYFPGDQKMMPEIVIHPPFKCVMSIEQEGRYWIAREQEIKLDKPPSQRLFYTDRPKYEELKRMYIMARKNILSRSASNFNYPYIKGYKGAIEPEKKFIPDYTVDKGGWISNEEFKNGQLMTYSMKFVTLIVNIVLHLHQKHVVFTFFKDKAGAVLLKTLLNSCGISTEIYTGDLSDSSRKKLLETYNSYDNRYGDIIRVLIYSEAGAEGITLLDVRHLHILESSPRVNKTRQAIGRAARFGSHNNLPADERILDVWFYWSVSNRKDIVIKTTVKDDDGNDVNIEKRITDFTTIDEILFDKGEETDTAMNSFLQLLQKYSVNKK